MFNSQYNISSFDGKFGFQFKQNGLPYNASAFSAAGDINRDGMDGDFLATNNFGNGLDLFFAQTKWNATVELTYLANKELVPMVLCDAGPGKPYKIASHTGIGDFNNNGYSDIIACCTGQSTGTWPIAEGVCYIIDGSNLQNGTFYASSLNGANGFNITGEMPIFGQYCTGDLDVNGDGFTDVVISGYDFVHFLVVYGGSNYHLPTYTAASLYSNGKGVLVSVSDSKGRVYPVGMVVKVGNFNGDRYDDFAISTSYDSFFSSAGSVVIVYGSNNLPPLINFNSSSPASYGLQTYLPSFSINADQYGYGLTAGSDYNHNGLSDVVVAMINGTYVGDQQIAQTLTIYGTTTGISGPVNIYNNLVNRPSPINTTVNYFLYNGVNSPFSYDTGAIVALENYNNDSYPDLFTGFLDGNASMFLGGANTFGSLNGSNGYTYLPQGSDVNLGVFCQYFSIGDVNNDTLSDFAAIDASGSRVFLGQNMPIPTNLPSPTVSPSPAASQTSTSTPSFTASHSAFSHEAVPESHSTGAIAGGAVGAIVGVGVIAAAIYIYKSGILNFGAAASATFGATVGATATEMVTNPMGEHDHHAAATDWS